MNALILENMKQFKVSYYRLLTAVALIISLAELLGCATEPAQQVVPVTVDSIIQQSQAAVPANAIIQKIADSGTVYRMTASQLADLRNQGVSNAVIDYMQNTYILAVKRNQQMTDRYLCSYDWNAYGYGPQSYGWPYAHVPSNPGWQQPGPAIPGNPVGDAPYPPSP